MIYAAGPSPWGHAMPWGDVTTVGNTLNLVVFDWPADGRLLLPNLQTEIAAAAVVVGGTLKPVTWTTRETWTELQVPAAQPDRPASVVAVRLKSKPRVDPTLGIPQNSSPVYHAYPFGLLTFHKPGKHTVAVSLIEGDREKASLEAVRLSPAE